MNSSFTRRTSHLLLIAAIFFACSVASDALAQLRRRSTRVTENKGASARQQRRQARREAAPVASRTEASIQSDSFIDLGNSFRAKENWNAAEAAYKEAIKAWAGNAEALSELGFLYTERGKWTEAQQTYSKLRAVNSSDASELLSEINRRQAALKH